MSQESQELFSQEYQELESQESQELFSQEYQELNQNHHFTICLKFKTVLEISGKKVEQHFVSAFQLIL